MTRSICALLVLAAAFHSGAHAQSAAQLPDAPTPAAPAPTVRNLPRNFLQDQAAIWTSPFRARGGAAVAGLFLIASAGVLGSDDSNIMRHHFLNQSTANHANTVSTGITSLLVAAPVAYFGIGHLSHNSEVQETGALAGEAMIDSLAVNEIFKIASRRERPTLDNARGNFFQPGVGFDSSFASNHSVIAWSSATVIASRSDHLLVKIAAYGLATGVSATRIVGRDHFPSDVYVGSAVGWLIGRYVRYHHSRTLY